MTALDSSGGAARTVDSSVSVPDYGFRPDIQGLRALAVALVVVFHFLPAQLEGGYIGVDVFFVISGFLITGHLLRELDRTGRISVTRFWARRVRRLLPAAFLVLAFSLIASLFIVRNDELAPIAVQIAASAAYVENWLIYGQSLAHVVTVLSPVEHYWSLSIEEQFYIVWPLLLVLVALIAARIALRRGSRADSGRTASITILLAVIFVASLVFLVVGTLTEPIHPFLNTFARVWEFAAGGLTAIAMTRGDRVTRFLSRRGGSILFLIVSWIALLVLLLAARLYTATTSLGGGVYVIPVVATVVLLFGGAARRTGSAGWLLSFRPIQKIGDWSYSIYLWHWSLLFFFLALYGVAPRLRWCLVLGVISIALAALTKRFVEDPLRRSARWSRRSWPSFAFAVAGAAVFAVACAIIVAGSGGKHAADVFADHVRVSETYAMTNARVVNE